MPLPIETTPSYQVVYYFTGKENASTEEFHSALYDRLAAVVKNDRLELISALNKCGVPVELDVTTKQLVADLVDNLQENDAVVNQVAMLIAKQDEKQSGIIPIIIVGIILLTSYAAKKGLQAHAKNVGVKTTAQQARDEITARVLGADTGLATSLKKDNTGLYVAIGAVLLGLLGIIVLVKKKISELLSTPVITT